MENNENQTESLMQEMVNMQRAERQFTILQRERVMNEEQQAKNKSALMAGICIIGACVAIHFNNADISQIIQHELSAFYSWQSLGQYFADLGPLTTMLATGAAGFTARFLKHSKKFKDARNQFIDMNNALAMENVQGLGGEENAKSR